MQSGCSRAICQGQQQKLGYNEQRQGNRHDSPHEWRSTSLTSPDVDTQGVLIGLLCFTEPRGEVGMAGAEPLTDSPLFKLSALDVSGANAHALVQCHHASLPARHAAFLACSSSGLSAAMPLLHTAHCEDVSDLGVVS